MAPVGLADGAGGARSVSGRAVLAVILACWVGSSVFCGLVIFGVDQLVRWAL